MTRTTKSKSFEDLLVSYMNALRLVRDRFGHLSLSVALQTKCFRSFCIWGLLGGWYAKGGMVQFAGPSGKFAIRPTGQRGDPLIFFMYGVLIDIATKNGTAGLREYLSLLVGVSSAISVKSNQRPALCTEIRRVRAPSSRTDSRVSRTTENAQCLYPGAKILTYVICHIRVSLSRSTDIRDLSRSCIQVPKYKRTRQATRRIDASYRFAAPPQYLNTGCRCFVPRVVKLHTQTLLGVFLFSKSTHRPRDCIKEQSYPRRPHS